MAITLSIQVGRPRILGTTPQDGTPSAGPRGPWESAIVKAPVPGPVRLRGENLDGDQQADRKHHGGPDKAVLAYAVRHYEHWRRTHPQQEWRAGAFGENLTVDGLDESAVCVGDVWGVGSARLEVSQPRQPCWKLARLHGLPSLVQDVLETGFGGWYLRIAAEGTLAPGDSWRLLERPHPALTIALVNHHRWHVKDDAAMNRTLAECEAMTLSWREAFQARLGG